MNLSPNAKRKADLDTKKQQPGYSNFSHLDKKLHPKQIFERWKNSQESLEATYVYEGKHENSIEDDDNRDITKWTEMPYSRRVLPDKENIGFDRFNNFMNASQSSVE